MRGRAVRFPLLGVVLLLALVVPSVARAATTVRIHVFTPAPAPGAVAPPDYPDRKDTVRDLRMSLAPGYSGLKVRLVDRAEEADVVVEVIGRQREESDAQTYAVSIRVAALGQDPFPLVGRSKARRGDFVVWRPAADDAAVQVLRWVRENREHFAAARSSSK